MQELTRAGVHVRTVGAGVFQDCVCDVAANAACIAASTSCEGSDAILLFDCASGALLRSFGEAGDVEGALFLPVSIRFSPDGNHLLITEDANCRLSVFTLSGGFVRCLGVGLLNRPSHTEVASNGDIVVSEIGGNRVCVLSPDGSSLLRSFGVKGNTNGSFRTPASLAMHDGKLYVLDADSDRVQVFA